MGDMYELTDRRYVKLDGTNSMTGALILPGSDPRDANEAVRKAYVDTLTGALPTAADIAAAIAVLTNPGTGVIDTRIAAAVADYLPLAGGVMLGALTLSGAPTVPLHAATKAYADLMVPLGGGIMTGPLTLSGAPVNNLHAATKLYVDSLPVGPTTYDAIVAPAGGDYTSIVTACATEAVGARIFVERGTYNETANIAMKDGQMLIGQNPEDTIIDFGAANRKITPSGAGTNRLVKGLTVQGSIADVTVEMNGTYDRVENCRVIGTGAAFDGVEMNGQYSIAKDNYIIGFSRAGNFGLHMSGNYGTAYGNAITNCDKGIRMATYGIAQGNQLVSISSVQIHTSQLCVVSGNQLLGNCPVEINGDSLTLTGNFIRGDVVWGGDRDLVIISNNTFYLNSLVCAHSGSHDCVISGNTFNTDDGITWAGYQSSIIGNTFYGTAHIELSAASKYNNVTGNNLAGSTQASATRINDLGLQANMAMNNQGVAPTLEKHFVKMQNKSGGALVAGDTVVYNAAASGDQFTTTVTQGDHLVIGALAEGVNNDAWGYIQTKGKIVTLKVNGTINIAIGDLLGTYTAAGIAMKAAAADTAFAIALEAYANNDSLGVIDALLVSSMHF